jgi:heme-degrading monooxygenase HmoA
MAIVKINALEVPPEAGEEIAKRFSARLDELSKVDGFEGFELLRPTGDAESRWFVYTRWADEASYQAWRNSDAFARGHAQSGGQGGHPGGAGGNAGPGGGEAARGPMSMGATLLEFEVAVAAAPSGS